MKIAQLLFHLVPIAVQDFLISSPTREVSPASMHLWMHTGTISSPTSRNELAAWPASLLAIVACDRHPALSAC